MIQHTVFLISVVLMLVIAVTFGFVALNSTKEAVAYPSLQQKSYSLRAKFFWVLTIAGVLITVITTLDLPYAATRGNASAGATPVDVDGRQWAWQVSQSAFQKGETLLFNVTAADVTHGLGVYDPNMRMIGQTQAMPGYSNLLELTVNEPGTYKLMCMEYCGVAHHAMISEITISE